MQHQSTDKTRRAAFAAGLRELADLIESTALPLPSYQFHIEEPPAKEVEPAATERPDGCPKWCTGEHQEMGTHLAQVDSTVVDDATVTVTVSAVGSGEPYVIVDIDQVGDHVLLDLNPRQARALMRRLAEAVEIADGTWAPLAEAVAA